MNLLGLSLPPIDIFKDGIYLGGTSGKTWDPMELGSVEPEADDYTAESYDAYFNVQVIVSLVRELSKGKVLKHTLDGNGKPTGSRNEKSYTRYTPV